MRTANSVFFKYVLRLASEFRKNYVITVSYARLTITACYITLFGEQNNVFAYLYVSLRLESSKTKSTYHYNINRVF